MRKYDQMSFCVRHNLWFELHMHKISYAGDVNCPDSSKGFIRINLEEFCALQGVVDFPAEFKDIEPVLREFHEQQEAISRAANS